eukprot:g16752.t1
MSKSASTCALVAGAFLGVASASEASPWRQQVTAGAFRAATHVGQSGTPTERDDLPMPLKHAKVTAGSDAGAWKLPSQHALLTRPKDAASDAGAWQLPSQHALLARPKDAEVTAAGGDLAGKATGFEMVADTYYKSNATNGDSNGDTDGGRRQLQTCSAGSGIFVTSSEFPNLEGCMSEFDIFEGGEIEYLTEDGLGIIFAAQPTGLTEELWFAQYLTAASSNADQITACNSEEPASLVHPSEATWVCLFPDGSVDYATPTTFGVECGCDDDDGVVSTTPTTSTSGTDDVSPTPSGSCSDGSSIFITSSEFPNLEGCLSEVEVFAGGEIEYLTEEGLGIIFAAAPTGSTEELWFAQYLTALTSDAEQVPACNSEEPASLVHPADATWVCLFPDESVDYGTSTTFDVDCGCDGDRGISSTPSTTTSSTDITTPSPVPAPTAPSPTPTGSCPDGSSITVTSSEFPNLEGCLSEVEVFEGGEIEYLTEDGLGIILASAPTGQTEELWFAVYLTAASSNADQITACNSEEPASLVHPSEATWICLFSDNSVDYATPTTFGVECGCDGATTTTTSSTDDGTIVSPTPSTTTTSSTDDGAIVSPTPSTTTTSSTDDGAIVSPTPTTTTTSSTDDGAIVSPTPAPVVAGGDDDSPAGAVSADDDTEDETGIVGSTGGAVGLSPSVWSAAAGFGVAAMMTLAMGLW